MADNKRPASGGSWKRQLSESMLDGGNALYLEALYEAYLQDSESIPVKWREYFAALPAVNKTQDEVMHSQVREFFRRRGSRPLLRSTPDAAENSRSAHDHKQVRVLQLINAYRFLGHLQARVNPLGPDSETILPELTLQYHELAETDLDTVFNTGSLTASSELTLGQIFEQLQETYCDAIGTEYMHLPNTEEKRWIQQRLESVWANPEFSERQRRYILDRLTDAEILERYLHTKYVGQKRFSLEGAESLIPLLDELIQAAGDAGVREVVIGMAHRGRLNTLVNILGKSPAMLFKEFEGLQDNGDRTGDVKYHMGYSSDLITSGGPIHVALAFNPSHLEIVGPVVLGSVRARQEHYKDSPGDRVLPVVIHGDAAFAGQGVVMETLNMSGTRGFKTRGTVRIVINNQIGFTTSTRRDARSTHYCTDVAKMVDAPIFHVNADDPEAVVFITQVALDYRMKFHKDVIIDLVCYRRHGHNEADEPAATQPRMYKLIRALRTTRELYAKQLVEENTISTHKIDDMIQASRKRLEDGIPVVPHLLDSQQVEKIHPVNWARFADGNWDQVIDTTISAEEFIGMGTHLATLPEGFTPHARVQRVIDARAEMAQGERAIDWGFAELLAYGSLLRQGFPVRLSGQDSERGTFFHRHAVIHNLDDGRMYAPLKTISDGKSQCTLVNTLLSEEAVLAFEYGYATTEPDTLVIWEAQFGDFANGAQVVIDQFISSGEQKWGRLSGLTMFLPHGFEGMGPEHSSARLERYLQLCAQFNIQVCIPTTPAQVFHMLRRQMLREYRKPLIVMTPKSLLRHPSAISYKADFTTGKFQTVIDEIDDLDKEKITRIIFCSGKIFYDLLSARRDHGLEHVAILRIEQPYPFPGKKLEKLLKQYIEADHFVWCQEEPMNQGAWFSQQHYLRRVLGGYARLERVSRPASASPAVGSLKVHQKQQKDVVEQALGLASQVERRSD
ncbi:MAG: 2-oxoglutarate dehydrogenase E1 component [Gammaproteobacteria bacterium]